MTQPKIKVKDMVSTKPNVSPSRQFEEVELHDTMMIHGEMRPAFRVMGLPYFAHELTLDLPWIE